MTFKCGSCEVSHQINELWYVYKKDNIINLDNFLKETEGNFEVEPHNVFCYICLGAHYPDAGMIPRCPPLSELEPVPIKLSSETTLPPPDQPEVTKLGAPSSDPLCGISPHELENVSSGTLSQSIHTQTMKMMMDMFKNMQEQMDGLKHLGKPSVSKEIETEVTSVRKEPIFTSSTGITREMATNSGGKTFNIL